MQGRFSLHYAVKWKNRVFSEKEMASLFKNGHFKNVHFRKIATQIYYIVFSGNYLCGPANAPSFVAFINC